MCNNSNYKINFMLFHYDYVKAKVTKIIARSFKIASALKIVHLNLLSG